MSTCGVKFFRCVCGRPLRPKSRTSDTLVFEPCGFCKVDAEALARQVEDLKAQLAAAIDRAERFS